MTPTINIITYEYFGGGSESYIRRLLYSNNFRANWFYLSNSIPKSDLLNVKYISLGNLPSFKSFRLIPFLFHSVMTILRSRSNDRFISFGFYPSVLCLFLSILNPRIRWIMTQREEYTWSNYFHRLILYLCKLRCHSLEVNSFCLYSRNISTFLLSRKTFLSTNVAFDSSTTLDIDSDLAELCDTYDTIYIYVANNRPVKNPMLAISAFSYISKRIPSACCIIVGKGYESLPHEITERVSGCSNFKVLGRVPELVVSQYLQIADVALSTSLSEGSSYYLFEALYRNCILFVNNIPSNSEYVLHGRTGYVFDTNCSLELSSMLMSIHFDSSLKSTLKEHAKKMIVPLSVSSPHYFGGFSLTSGETFTPNVFSSC